MPSDFGTGVKKLLDLFNRAKFGLVHVDHHPQDDQLSHLLTSNYGFKLIPAWKYRPLFRLIPHWIRLLGASVTQVWLNALSFCLQESGKTPNGDLNY
jgi:hypothetical protein